jgi:hypothetical protein
MVAVYFDTVVWEYKRCLLDLVETEDGTAYHLAKTVIDVLNVRIPKENVCGFTADTCNVMFGSNGGVATILKREYPHLMAVKCSCHAIHLCSSNSATCLPKTDDLIRNVNAHFSCSPKRCKAFNEFQEFFGAENHMFPHRSFRF